MYLYGEVKAPATNRRFKPDAAQNIKQTICISYALNTFGKQFTSLDHPMAWPGPAEAEGLNFF